MCLHLSMYKIITFYNLCSISIDVYTHLKCLITWTIYSLISNSLSWWTPIKNKRQPQFLDIRICTQSNKLSR
ncbi:hypothetical protein Hanom_Chr09g00849131 [Helianthus anomalus]